MSKKEKQSVGHTNVLIYVRKLDLICFLGFFFQPSDSTEVLYDAKVKMSRQALTEIQTLLEGEENWRTGALDNAVSQILVDLKPHNYEAWRWRFEDTFGVELDTLLKVSSSFIKKKQKQLIRVFNSL